MSLQQSGTLKSELTFIARKRPLTRMNNQMLIQITPRRTLLPTLVTLVRLFACVFPLVNPHPAQVGKPHAAHVTHKRLLVRVSARVRFEGVGASKFLATCLARKRLLSRVSSRVAHKRTLVREFPLALVARKRLHAIVNAHVRAQTMRMRKASPTLATPKWLLASVNAQVSI